MNLDFGKLKDVGRKYMDKARQMAEGLSELEIKTETATNDDKWGPHGALMAEITKEAFRDEEYKEILAVIARRLASEPKYWRRVYKSLLLLEYMAKNGPERMVSELQSNHNVFSRLQSFEYIDDAGKDQGLNVRNRAKELWKLVNDGDEMAHERERANMNRNKYAGYDARGMSSAPRGSGGGGSGSGEIAGARSATRTSSGEDPVEATRKRLEALKAAEDEHPTTPSDAPGPQKKKLSDVQVNSSIASTLAKNFNVVSKPPAAAAAAAAAAASGPDLLAFDEPAPAPASAGDDWADFKSAPAPPQVDAFSAVAAGDEWSNFSAPSTNDPLAGLSVAPSSDADPFAAMAVSAAPAVLDAQSPGRAELPADIFSMPAVEPLPGLGAKPFGFGIAPVPVGNSDSIPASHMGGPNMGGSGKFQIPGPVKKDPFADLM